MTAEPHSKSTPRKLLDDRRTSMRFPCNLQVTCRTGGGKTGVDWPARVRNISGKGVGLLLSRAFSAGTYLTVCFHRPNAEPFVAKVQVVHGRFENDIWYHGCVFTRRLLQEEVDALVK